jgi:hypothetical protein
MVPLQACLREIHEANKQAVAKEIEERRKHGAPLNDQVDFAVIQNLARQLADAAAMFDAKQIEDVAKSVMQKMGGGTIAPLLDYEPDPDLDGIEVAFVVVSDADRKAFLAEAEDAYRAVRDAMLANAPTAKLAELDRRAQEVQEAFAAKAVGRITGLRDGDIELDIDGTESIESMLPALSRSGLLLPLVTAARFFQGLPPKKAAHFGQPAPSISAGTSIAQGAAGTVGVPSVAMASSYLHQESAASISPGQSTSQTDAPAVSS